MNMGQNLTTAYGPGLWELLNTRANEEELNKSAGEGINQIHNLRPYADPKKRTMFILAPGASLTMYKDWLPRMKETGYVLASPTACPYLVKQAGVTPDLVMVVDAHPASVGMVELSGAHLDPHCQLVMSLEAPPTMPTLFGRDRTYWVRTAMPGPDGSLDWEPYSVFQNLLAGLVRVRIAQMGCVTNMMIGLTMALHEYAGWEWDRIVLVGCDYGYWKGWSRVPLDGSAKMVKFDKTCKSNMKDGMWSDRRMVRYKGSLLMMWLQARMNIWTMSHGILREFPRITPRQIDSGKWPAYPNGQKLADKIYEWAKWYQATDIFQKESKHEADVAGDIQRADGVDADGSGSGDHDGPGDSGSETGGDRA
jgi:hypothetical protein